MATYGSYITNKRLQEMNYDYSSRHDLTIGSQGRMVNLYDPKGGENGEGDFVRGDAFDLSLLQAAYPERFDTAQLARGQVLSSVDTVASDPFQQNLAGVTSLNNADAEANLMTGLFSRLFPSLTREEVRASALGINRSVNREIERRSRGGFLGITPGLADSPRAGEDNAFYKSLSDLYTLYGMAERAVTNRGSANTSTERYLNKSAPTAVDQDQRNLEIILKLREFGFDPAARLTEEQLQDPDTIERVLNAAQNERTLDAEQLMRFDVSGPGLDADRQEAIENGLNPEGLMYRQFLYERAHQKALTQVNAAFNNLGETKSPEEQRAMLAQISNLAQTVGPDFVREAMLEVNELNPNWEAEAWKSLSPGTRQVLESIGHSETTFARDASGEMLPSVRNTYTYQEQAKNLALQTSATESREMIFELGFHDGYANWTRRFSDTLKIDIAEDPFAMYFLAGTVPAGVGAGLYFGSGVAAGTAASSLGRLSFFSAIDGGLAGIAEGYIAGTSGQLESIRSGARYSLDFSGVHDQALLYGTMGAVGGGALSALPGGIGYGLRGTAKASKAAQNLADDIASKGMFGATTREKALLKIAEREATVEQLDGARMYDNIENTGLAIRLNAEEVSAKDVLSEVIPTLVHRADDEVHGPSINVDRIFDADELQRNGVSSADAVDLVYGIQRRLGPGETLSEMEFDRIVTEFFAAARDHADKFKIDRKGGIDGRIDLIDGVTRRKIEDSRRNFIGGNGGTDLKSIEQSFIKKLITRLGEGGRVNQRQVKKLAELALRMSDERPMRRILNLIENTSYLTPEEKLEFKLKMEGVLERGIKAREDSFLNKIFDVEGALSLLRNERSIRIVQELGVSPSKLSQYIHKYRRIVGDEKAIAELDREMPDVRKAIEAIVNDEGLEIIPDSRASFNVTEWLNTSEATENIREFMDARKTLSRRVNKAATEAGAKSDDKLDAVLKRKLQQTTKDYQKALKAIGREVDEEEAYELMLERASREISWGNRSSAEKSTILSNALDRLMYRVSPDMTKVGEARADGWWMANVFKDTNIGRRLADIVGQVALWPQTQQRLFRSRQRVVRGVATWISGQHISARVYSNSTDFMSVEAIVEGAAREVVPYVQMHKQINRKLGSTMYRLFDKTFIYLRQMNKLTGPLGEQTLEEIDKMAPGLRAAYKNFGGDEGLLKDLKDSQSFYTGLMTRALAELEEAGMGSSGISAARYMPNHIRGNLSAERAGQWVDDFTKLRRGQLLKDDAALDLDLIDSLGWINIQRRDAASGKGIVKDFTVPEDSPFYVSDDAAVNKKLAQDFIKGGLRATRNVDAGETGVEATTGTAGRVGSLKDVVERQADLTKTRERVNAVRGTDPLKPAAVSSETATTAHSSARGVAGNDPVLNELERALSEAMTSTKATREAYEETGASFDELVEDITSAIMERQSTLMEDTIQSTAGSSPRVLRRRKPMSANQKIKLVNDLDAYGNLSEGHRSLLVRIDNLIAEGMLDADSARVVMLAYVDIDPSVMSGASFARMDTADRTYVGMALVRDRGELVQLRRIAELSDDGNDAVNVASTLVHEVGHLAFASAPPRLQAVIQSLLEQARRGDNEITELFAKFGIDINYATSNVHEFAAHLAEIALVRNQTTLAKRGPMGEFLAQFAAFFKKLFGDVGILTKESESVAEKLMGKEKWTAIRSAMKSMHDSFPEDSSADKIMRAFDVVPAERVDEMPIIAGKQSTEVTKLKQAQQMNELKRVARQEEMDKLLLEDDPDANMMQNIFKELTELEEEAVNLKRSLAKAEQKQMDAPAPKVETEAPKTSKPKLAAGDKPKLARGGVKKTGLTLAEAGGRKEAPKGELTPAQQKDAALKKAAETRAAKALKEALADKDSSDGQIRTALMGMAYEDLTPKLRGTRTRPKERMGAVIADEKIMNKAVEIARAKGVNEAKSYILQKAKNLTDAELDTGSQKGVKLKREGRLTTTSTKDNGTIDLEAKSTKNILAEAQEEVDSKSALLSSIRLDRDSLTPEQAKKVQNALISNAYRKVLLELMRDKPEIFGAIKLDEGTGFFKPSFAGSFDLVKDELEERLLAVLKDLGAKDITKVKTFIREAFQSKGIIGQSKSLDEDAFLNDALKQQALKDAEVIRRAETQRAAEAASETPIVREVQSAVAEGDLPKAKSKAEEALAKMDAQDEAKAEAPAPKAKPESSDDWPPAGSPAEQDGATAPYVLTRINDDSVDRAYVFHNQAGEPVFVSHTVAEETLPNGKTERVMYVDFESTTSEGEVTSYVNTDSGDPLQVIRAAFSKAEEDAEDLGVNAVFFSRGDVDGDNVQGAKIYKRLVEQAYPEKTVFSARANRGNPYLAVTLDNQNPLIPSLGSPFPFDQSYYLLTDARVRSLLRKTDWPIDLELKGKDLRKAIDSYLQENHTKLGDDIPTWDNNRRAVVPSPAPKAEAPAPKAEAPAPKTEAPAPKTEVPIEIEKSETGVSGSFRNKAGDLIEFDGGKNKDGSYGMWFESGDEGTDTMTGSGDARGVIDRIFSIALDDIDRTGATSFSFSGKGRRARVYVRMLNRRFLGLDLPMPEGSRVDITGAKFKQMMEMHKGEAEAPAPKAEAPAPKAEAPAPKAEAPAPKADERVIPRLEGETDAEFRARTSSGDLDLKTRYEDEALERLDAETETDEELFGPMAGGSGIGDPPTILPRAPGGAPDDDFGVGPKRAAEIREKVREYLEGVVGRAETKLPRSGSINANHRLADEGSLTDIYTRAVNGDTSLTTEEFKNNAKMRGYENLSALDIIAREYLHHAGGRFKSFAEGMSASGLDAQIGNMGNLRHLHERTFTEADLDSEGGEGIAKLFADAGGSAEGLMHYANTALGSIRVQKGLNELLGVKGAEMKDLFEIVDSSLRLNLKRTANGRGRTLSETEVDNEVTEYMQQLKKLYIRARGFNPVMDDNMKQSSRIAMNLAYSILGAKFAMSVLFVETPLALLRTSGLNPIKLAANASELGGAYARAAMGGAVQFPPLEKFMSALGVDTRLIKESVEDLSHGISNLRSNSMSRFGADSTGGMDEMGVLFTAGERVAGHGKNIKGAFRGTTRGTETGFGQRLLDSVEAFTGATADMTGMLSFMHPVTNAIREVSSNQAKGTLLKHANKLHQLSEFMRGKDLTDAEMIGAAREMGIPQTLAVYAAESGLLRPGMIERLIKLTGATSTTPGRDLNLSTLTQKLDSERAARRNTALNPRFFSEGAAAADEVDDNLVTSLNQYIAFFMNEMSPELRGTMKFTGENPLKDLLFQMLSYPIAAHQALVKNGMTARGPAMTAGILSSLVALEYVNRNLQTILHGKDEEARKEAMARLSRIPTQEDIVGALAMYGTSSPLFGAVGNYMRDLVGNPALRMYGHPDRNFPANPYSGPAISMMKRAYGTLSKAAGNIGTAVREDDSEGLRGALGDVGRLGLDILPTNAMLGGTGLKSIENGTNFLFGGTSYREGLKNGVVATQTAATRQTPGLMNPSVAAALDMSFSPFSDDSPSSPGEIMKTDSVLLAPTPQVSPAADAPVPSPQGNPPTTQISPKPGTGLVDILNRNK